jgi:hypothetical protein
MTYKEFHYVSSSFRGSARDEHFVELDVLIFLLL